MILLQEEYIIITKTQQFCPHIFLLLIKHTKIDTLQHSSFGLHFLITDNGRSPRGVMTKVLDCDIVISEFEFQSCFDISCRTHIVRIGINPPIFLTVW